MNLEDLESKGAFISDSLVPTSAKWHRFDKESGEVTEDEVSFFVRQASWVAYTQIGKEASESGEEVNTEALLIQACIRLGEKGEESLSYKQVVSLDAGLFNIFHTAVKGLYSPKN